MSRIRQRPHCEWIALIGTLAFLFAGTAAADPPGRVARLTQMSGTITFSPAGEDDWAVAQANRPIVTGDRLWSDARSHAELQIGAAALRLGSETSIDVLNLDDVTAQFQLAQGTLNLRVRRVYGDQVFEIDTPNLAFSVRRPGDYRIDVDPAGNATILRVRSGEGEAWGENAAYVIAAGQQYTFAGDGLRDYSADALPPPDAFDQWALDRDRREDAAVSASYVSPDVIGYSDLDEYGAWRNVEGYGNVWVPTAVAAGWAPYHYGRWAWVDPWGWTWVDDAPWGFAPFHYGRWAYLSSRWCWVPGPVAVRPVYAPALVAFVGGNGFNLALGVAGVAWFPLGVGEVYRPAYAVSRGYFSNVNVSNTVINTTVINNYYNNVNVTNVVYRNREVAGAVTAVPTTAFASGRPIAPAAVAVTPEVVMRQPVGAVAAVTPSRASLIAAGAVGAAAVAVAKPAASVLTRHAVAKTTPPPPPPSFAAKSQLLAAQPGKPLETDKINSLRPPKTVAERNLKVVGPSAPGAPAIKPVPLAKGRGAQPEDAATRDRGSREDKRGSAAAAGTPQSPATTGVPRPPQDRVPREEKPAPSGTPAGGASPSQQDRALREDRRGSPQAGPTPQPQGQDRAVREDKRIAPQSGPLPQPPSSSQERAPREDKRVVPQGTPQAQPAKPEGRPPPPPPPQGQQQQPPQQLRSAGKPEESRQGNRDKEKEKEKEKDMEKDKKDSRPPQ
jgi:hypothetical protein